jgi:hypothetical protein
VKGRRLDYHETTSSSKCNPIKLHIKNWRQGPQVVGWWLFKGRRSLYMMIRSEWKGEGEMYMNLLLEEGNRSKKRGDKYVFWGLL